MYDVCLVLKQVVDTLYDAPLAKHNFVPHGHQSVLHIRPESMHEVYAPVKEVLKKGLPDISPVSEYLAIEFLGEDLPHPFVPIVNICSCKTKSYNLPIVMAHQVQLDTVL